MKNSIVLLEVIVSLLLFSIIAIGSSKMMYTLTQQNKERSFIVENNLLLETTRLFVSKQNNLSQIKYRNTNLYFENNLLLKNVSKYEIHKNMSISNIEICLYQNSICQTWKIEF